MSLINRITSNLDMRLTRLIVLCGCMQLRAAPRKMLFIQCVCLHNFAYMLLFAILGWVIYSIALFSLLFRATCRFRRCGTAHTIIVPASLPPSPLPHLPSPPLSPFIVTIYIPLYRTGLLHTQKAIASKERSAEFLPVDCREL